MMRRTLSLLSSITLVPLVLSELSCTPMDFGVGTTEPVDGRVQIRIYEGFSTYGEEGNPEILLAMRTEEIYGCCNFSILADVEKAPGKVTVTLQGIFRPEICLTALGPATLIRSLPLETGTYRLVVRNGDVEDWHTLEVSDASIRLTEGSTFTSVVSTTLFWRVPPRSFAYLCGTTVEDAWIYQDFLDSLLAIPSVREFRFPASGEIPYPTSSSGYWQNQPARYFTYANEADFDSAGTRLVRYTREVIRDKQGIGLELLNWRNVSFMSWVIVRSQ
jgi:hypothetical protein